MLSIGSGSRTDVKSSVFAHPGTAVPRTHHLARYQCRNSIQALTPSHVSRDLQCTWQAGGGLIELSARARAGSWQSKVPAVGPDMAWPNAAGTGIL